MKKQIFAVSVILGLFVPYLPALAVPSAAENAPGIVYLGQKIDPQTGKLVDGIKFIHYKNGYVKNNAARKPGSGSTCYAFLASGARWKTTEDYLVDPTNSRGLDGATVRDLLKTAQNGWDNQVSATIFGNEVSGVVNGAESSAPDGKNEFMFGNAGGPGVIAVTTVWGNFYGSPSQRQLVEWDMVFDDQDFDWSAGTTGVAGKMDFLNIAAHEIGHATGMGHPSNTCTDETMYAYADYGETKKRDLNTGDIAGIKSLYK